MLGSGVAYDTQSHALNTDQMMQLQFSVPACRCIMSAKNLPHAPFVRAY